MPSPVDFTLGALRTHLKRHARVELTCPPFPPPKAGDPVRPVALFGSAVLALHGLRTEIGDVDLAVTPEAFARLADLGWRPTFGESALHPIYLVQSFGGHEVHAFEAWRADHPEIDLPLVLERAEFVEGWPCAPLSLIAHHKATSLVRGLRAGVPPIPKHVHDLANIAAHVAGVPTIASTW